AMHPKDSYERAEAEAGLRGLAEAQLEYARLAAASGNRRAFDDAVAAIVHQPEHSDLLFALADQFAMVTGDREAAAAMRLAGHRRHMEYIEMRREDLRTSTELTE